MDIEQIIPATIAAIIFVAAVVFVVRKQAHTRWQSIHGDVPLDDLIGSDRTKREHLDELRRMLTSKTVQHQSRTASSQGVWFSGPLGSGKTSAALALAAEAGVRFVPIRATELRSTRSGRPSRKIRRFFTDLRRAVSDTGGAVGYIEGFDGNSMDEMVLEELLLYMQSFDLRTLQHRFNDWFDKFVPAKNHQARPHRHAPRVLVVGELNQSDELEDATIRPQRFGRTVRFHLQPRADREQIAAQLLAQRNHGDDVTASLIADLTAGYTPARIITMLDEAQTFARSRCRSTMTMTDVLHAQLATAAGVAAELGYHPDERRRIAIHEAGHALVATMTRRDVKTVSILQRSSALRTVAHRHTEEHRLTTPRQTRDLIAVALAGRSAEQNEYGEASCRMSSDLACATTIAAQLVGGLGDGPGLLSLDATSTLVGGNLTAKVLADDKSREAAEALMVEGVERADRMVSVYRRALYEIADGLCANDELSGDEVRGMVSKYVDISERRGSRRMLQAVND